MKIIETTFERLPRERLVIGFEGENQRATVRIDCASVFAEYPNATPSLIVKPLFADAYPVVVDRNGTDVDWLITSAILSFSGDGEIQLVFYKDQVICKSAVSKIRVSRSLQVTGEMPDVVATWIENANRKLAEVDAQIVELEGMVDTATDAATRAEQSASTASTKAEQAAGSAATATEKATEATNAAGTATAKAAEAQTAAQTATEKATAAAESERIATAKAGEATTAATTATTKAEQATEAAQTATEKAADASASATAAQTSATNAASSATAASASETAAKASETAAGASATQAAQSVLDAGTAAQTAMQKAAEATQSATNAAASATNAATSAETASTKAGEAAQSAQAVAETAEQLADSLEQIDQNTQDIAELDERKANIDGYYPDMTVGDAEQLISSKYVENSEPYTFRTSGGSADIGNREYLDAVVGGTVAWNQMVRDEASENSTDFADVVTVTDAVEDAAGVKVKIEPVQDLHGYDNPWPAGGGVNKLKPNLTGFDLTTWVEYNEATEKYTIKQGTGVVPQAIPVDHKIPANTEITVTVFVESGQFTSSGSNPTISIGGYHTEATSKSWQGSVDLSKDTNLAGKTYTVTVTTTAELNSFEIFIYGNPTVTSNIVFRAQIELGTNNSPSWHPYSNICPISGHTGLTVTRTGKNLLGGLDLARAFERVTYPSQFSIDTTTKTFTFTRANSFDGSYVGCIFAPKNKARMTVFVTYSNTALNNSIRVIYTDGTYTAADLNSTNGEKTTYRLVTSENKQVERITLHYYSNGLTTVYYDESGFFEGVVASEDFAPYSGQTYEVSLPSEAGTVYGGELTVNADGSGSLVVDRAVWDMGAVPWNIGKRNNSDTGRIFNYGSFPNIKPKAVLLSDSFMFTGSNSIVWEKMGFGEIHIVDTTVLVCIDASDREEARAYLSGKMMCHKLAEPQTYNLTASEIRTLLGTNNIWSDAGQTALTYTGTDEHLTLESGKKYLSRISGTDSMLLGSGQEITAVKGTDNVFDLTQMFGTAVADYVYGQGASFFRRWFPNAVYPYNAGELKHVEGLQSHDMVGFNLWDEELESGNIDTTTGENRNNVNTTRSKNYIPVIPLTNYYMMLPWAHIFFYDANKEYISFVGNGVAEDGTIHGKVIATPANAYYMRFRNSGTYGTTYKNDICISLAHNNSRNGEYAPYEKHSYPLDSTVILRGIPKVGANGVYWDGDRYLPDGTVTRKFKQIVLDGVNQSFTASWGASDNGYAVYKTISDIDPNGRPFVLCDRFENSNLGQSLMPPWTVGGNSGAATTVTFKFPSTITSTANANNWLKTNNVTMIYPVATPDTETAQPYHSTQWVSDWGTEEYVTDSIVPVGHETRYPANLRDKLQHLPDAASGNGSYLIQQTDGQMMLTPFPAPPSTAGNYVLKATVTGGVATYTWEVAT